jgi:LuxR family maltose regulon positive regulatory protein
VNQQYNDLPAKLAVAFSFLYSSSGNVGSVFEHCYKATKLVREEDITWFCWAWYSCGLGHMMTGNLTESIKAFGVALEAGKKTGHLYLISTVAIRYAFCELQRGNFTNAYKTCQELLELITAGGYTQMAENEWSFAGLYTTMGYIEYEWAEGESLRNSRIGYELSCKGADITSRVFSTIVYIRVLRYQGELKKVEGLMGELDTVLKERELFPYLLHTLHATKLGAYLRFRQMDKALHLVEMLHLSAEAEVNDNNELLYTSFAWMLLAESRLEEAETLLNKLHTLAEALSRRERLVEIKVLLGVLHHLREEEESVLTFLVDSLHLAEEENLIMHYINEGEHISRYLELLYRRYTGRNFKFSRKFLGKVLRAIGKKTKQADQASFYSLSKREVEVLRFMAEELSNQEIADQMYVSLNTVKAHAKNIHLKLEVDSRIKAVAKARELGLI